MLKIAKLTLLFSLLICSLSEINAQGNSLKQATNSFLNANGNDVLVVVHRGDWRNAPENSLKAIENTIAMGADMVEIDIQKTKDGQLILMHDKTLDRTTTGKGKVADFTLEEIKKLRLKSGIGIATDHTVPTLIEAMLLAKDKILVNIDKGYSHFAEVYNVLQLTKTTMQTVLKSNMPLDKVLADKGVGFLKDVIFMPVINLDNATATSVLNDYQSKIKPVAVELVFSTDTSSIINRFKEIKKNGARVWVNTLWPSLNAGRHDDLAVEQGDIKNSWAWLISKGVNIIQTDRPKELLAYLRANKLHN